MEITFKLIQQQLRARDVTRHVPDAARRAQTRRAAFLRRRARRSLRRRKRASAPGQPPSVRSPEPNLKTIFFAYNPDTRSTIIGPVVFPRRSTRDPASETQEFGGVTRDRQTRQRKRYVPRPFMGPALEAEAAEHPADWADAIGP